MWWSTDAAHVMAVSQSRSSPEGSRRLTGHSRGRGCALLRGRAGPSRRGAPPRRCASTRRRRSASRPAAWQSQVCRASQLPPPLASHPYARALAPPQLDLPLTAVASPAAYAHRVLTGKGGAAERGATRFTAGVLYFVLMETLQGLSYSVIDQCESATNHALTVLGFAHICGQPYFTHLMCGAFYRREGKRGIQNDFVLRLCVVAGGAFFMRYVLAAYDVRVAGQNYIPLDGVACPNTEWIRASTATPGGANTTCTFSGSMHLAWSLPLYQPTYFTPSVFIHSFVMFAPFAVTPGVEAKVFGLFLFLTGPYMSTLLTVRPPSCDVCLLLCALCSGFCTRAAAGLTGAYMRPGRLERAALDLVLLLYRSDHADVLRGARLARRRRQCREEATSGSHAQRQSGESRLNM